MLLTIKTYVKVETNIVLAANKPFQASDGGLATWIVRGYVLPKNSGYDNDVGRVH